MRGFAIYPLIALLLCGCADPDDSAEMNEPEVVEEMARPGIFADYFDDGGYILHESHALVIRDIEFFGKNEDGTAEGFDLDDTTSDDTDESTCRHPDLSDAAGQEGIDNQIAVIWTTLLGPLVGEATHALMKGAINEGRLLMTIELTGVDDLKNDDDVSMRFFRSRADPYVGTFGLLAPDQTYYVDPEIPATTIDNLKIVDGEVVAGPVEFQIPIDILAEFFIVRVTSGKIKFTIHEDGSATGYLGGVINVADVLDEGYQTNAEQEFRLVTPFFLDNTDMLPNDDGGCDGISLAIRIRATTGFVVHYDDE
jgi:hypothetical protein